MPLLPRRVSYSSVPVLCHPNSLVLELKGSVTTTLEPSVGSLIPHGLPKLVRFDEVFNGSNFLLDFIGCIRRVVDNALYLLTRLCIDIGEKPVADDISLYSPSESQ